ncbi:MAG: hypothetical protein VB128_01005 [Sedimentibacter saalensis]|uniref:hypothetical protein n=1 Tax=Sedimentibacter saalensis TaxID=130788 RepID=UPI002B1F7438|nr:hypothetical protein [Sedimentibacter saalensis]MEA5093509.1 hypothetical protein [Sedimentibacter saalensis]
MYLFLLITLGLFAIGDILGIATKAKLSSVFVALMLFLVGFLTGIIPADIIDQANLTGIGKMSTAFVVFNMGTSVNLSEMKKEWKVVVMSLLAMAVTMLSILIISPFIGIQAALVSIPIVNGGIVATQIMTEAALTKGYAIAAALGTIVFAVQKFVGTIPASRCGLSEAKLLVEDYRLNKSKGIDLMNSEVALSATTEKTKKVPFYSKYEKYFTGYVTLGVVALFAYIASLIGNITGISLSIWCLILGMTVNQLGFVPPKILDKGKSSGLFMVATFCTLIPSLAKISISDLMSLSIQTAAIFAAALIGCYLTLYLLPTWKFIGSKNLAIGIAMSQLLGFPATFLIVNEVATAVTETEEEKDYVVKKLTPAFVVSGFVSVTTISILIAGIFAKFV